MRINEFVERTKEESKKELEDYKRFVHVEPDTLLGIFDNMETSFAKPNVVTKLQEVQIESQGPELQSESFEVMPTESEGLEP